MNIAVRPKRDNMSYKSLRLIGIPKSFVDKSLKDFEGLPKVKEYVRSFISSLEKGSVEKGIFFVGSNGVGKTMLSSIILKEAYRCRYTCKRTTFVEYIDVYTSCWQGGKTEREMAVSDLYNYYKGVEVLVLDEVGKEIDTKVSAPILEDCLRYREDNDLITIICTNVSVEDFQERYGNSIMSLLHGNMTSVKIVSTDKRK